MSNWAQKKKKPEVKGNGGGDAYNAMNTGVPDLGGIANDIDNLLKESEANDRAEEAKEEERARARERKRRRDSCICG